MTNNITQHNLFRLVHSKAETKADITDRTVKAIIGAEAELRDFKTATLREARLAREALMPAVPVRQKRRGRQSI